MVEIATNQSVCLVFHWVFSGNKQALVYEKYKWIECCGFGCVTGSGSCWLHLYVFDCYSERYTTVVPGHIKDSAMSTVRLVFWIWQQKQERL